MKAYYYERYGYIDPETGELVEDVDLVCDGEDAVPDENCATTDLF